MIENIGKFAEYLVLTELLMKNIEAYQALSFNQIDYDITVVLSIDNVVRVQVKATDLQNSSTNNTIKNVNKRFDYMVLVVVDNGNKRFFILSKKDVEEAKSATNALYVSENKDGIYSVKNDITNHENCWDKIINHQPKKSLTLETLS